MSARSARTHRVAVLLTEQEYQSLKQLMLSRKQADLTLPTRWGMSDLVREVLLRVLGLPAPDRASEVPGGADEP